jgi:hypothetical protein
MNGLTFAFLIVTVVMISKVAQIWIETRNAKPEVDEEFEGTLAKIASLEERIQVLERIVTEDRFDLKREIDSL